MRTMMVPRSFIYSSVSSPSRKQHGLPSKPAFDVLLTQNDDSALQLPFDLSPQSMHTNPVVIPPKRGRRVAPAQTETNPKTPKRNRMTRQSSSSTLSDRTLPAPIASILEATAIPVPRHSWAVRETRKLRGNHVQDFSRLLQGGLNGITLERTGNSSLDFLLTPPEEEIERPFTSSDCDSETLSCSVPSISVSSVPSLENDVETPSSISVPFTPSSRRSLSERVLRRRRPSNCENCAYDHPLLDTELSDSGDEHIVTSQQSSSLSNNTHSKMFISSRSFPRLGSFKSNLTASLRAIKSAAQSVSAFASPSVQPDDFLTRSLFTITPEMTDDRRPPPMIDTPSPALRRYLNPIMVSPAEMYSYQDQPHESPDPCKSPISVQMQTYHRSGFRGSRKSRFRFSSSKNRDRTSLPFDPEAPVPFSRQREPRENSDFLRMVVLEMNMRRRGKLRDDVPTRARLWLPPRKGSQAKFVPYDFEEEDEEENSIPTRWIGVSVESF
ncbi:hypothetical protein BJY00DRAFT_274411 [Aspergillus carlsbadensis]|nr:hypothetical protein BJY00DRAFT_274411 [Aspergillus carlsbadensis]